MKDPPDANETLPSGAAAGPPLMLRATTFEATLDASVRGTITAGEDEREPDAPGHVVALRYQLVQVLGRGAHGRVWEAVDLLTGGRVAVKLLNADLGTAGARIRREVASLRLLRLPGVVQLLDEGADDNRSFLVMELVLGEPFPGVRAPAPWSRLSSAVTSLLETLARMHAVGIVHRDLKPANILVDDLGRPTILDFGLAREETSVDEGITDHGTILGTPAYLAPEQLTDDPVTARTDLYALGVILFEALSGRFPHLLEGNVMRMLYARLNQPPARLAVVAPDVPPAVAEIVDSLLMLRVEDRPRSAGEVLERLRGKRPGGGPPSSEAGALEPAVTIAVARCRSESAADGPFDEAELRGLFSGEDRLFHLPEDGARLLHRRTGGALPRVVEDVSAWVRAGLARWDGARVAVDRDVIDRLEAGLIIAPAIAARDPSEPLSPERRRVVHRSVAMAAEPGAPERLYHLVAGSDDDTDLRFEIASEARHLGHRLALSGRLGPAAAAVSEGLRAARRLGLSGSAHAVPLLSLGVEIALEERTPRALDRALYELYRVGPRTATIERLAGLVRAALALGHRTERALEAANELAPFADLELERRRQGLRAAAVRLRPPAEHQALLDEIGVWVAETDDPASRAAYAGWLGQLRYRQGRYAEAADLHAESAAGERWVTARLSALLRCASARMEAFQLGEAGATAQHAKEAAELHRLPFYQAHAEWIVRSVAYRTGSAAAPDLALVEASTQLRMGDIEAMVTLNEAAIAFRAGDLPVALELARRAQRTWAALGEISGGALLAASLALAAGGDETGDEAHTLSTRAIACPVPGIGIQALGLLARAGRAPEIDPETLSALAGQVASEAWDQRLEISSIREALGELSRRPSSP